MYHDEDDVIRHFTPSHNRESHKFSYDFINGDDCATFSLHAGERAVISIDSVSEGRHFIFSSKDAELIGGRALRCAASDLSAMGARPVGCVVSLGIRHGASSDDIAMVIKGYERTAGLLNLPVIGGDTISCDQWMLSVTVIGALQHKGYWRNGLSSGDTIWLLGELGWSALGCHSIKHEAKADHESITKPELEMHEAYKKAKGAYWEPRIWLDEALSFSSAHRVSAIIDVSDGLGKDLGRLATASKKIIHLHSLPEISPAFKKLAAFFGHDPHDLLWRGGEDFSLLIGARNKPHPHAIRLGYVLDDENRVCGAAAPVAAPAAAPAEASVEDLSRLQSTDPLISRLISSDVHGWCHKW